MNLKTMILAISHNTLDLKMCDRYLKSDFRFELSIKSTYKNQKIGMTHRKYQKKYYLKHGFDLRLQPLPPPTNYLNKYNRWPPNDFRFEFSMSNNP